MRIFPKVLAPANFNIFNISCSHIGSSLSHFAGIKEMIESVHSPFEGVNRNFVVHHGDWLDGRMVDDPLFASCTTAQDTAMKQIIVAANLFAPIAKNIVCGLEGNHDRYLRRFGVVAWMILERMGVANTFGTYSSKIHWVNKRTNELMFKQFATHGRKFINSVSPDPGRELANMQYQLQRHLYKKASDCYLMTKGHTHKLFHKEPIRTLYLKDDGEKIQQGYVYVDRERQTLPYIIPDTRWYANVGAFYKAYGKELHNFDPLDDASSIQTSYVEELELDPVELGYSVCMVRDEKIAGVVEVVV